MWGFENMKLGPSMGMLLMIPVLPSPVRSEHIPPAKGLSGIQLSVYASHSGFSANPGVVPSARFGGSLSLSQIPPATLGMSINRFMGGIPYYQNPFNPSTVIRFMRPEAAQVTLKVYGISTQEVATQVSEHRDAGVHAAVSIPRGDRAKPGIGVYFYRLTAGNFTAARRRVLLNEERREKR